MRRMSLAIMVTAIAVLGLQGVASAAGPAVNPGKFNVHFTAAQLTISGLGAVDAPSDQSLDLHANIAAPGKVGIPVNALTFPYIDLGDALPIAGLVATVGQSTRSDGTYDAATGNTSLPLNLFVYVGDGHLPNTAGLVNCKIPLAVTVDTGNHTFGSNTPINGTPADSAGNVVLAGIVPAPADSPAVEAGCNLYGLLASQLGSNAQIGLKLTGQISMPGLPNYPDGTPKPPASCPTTPSLCKGSTATLGSSALKVAKSKIATTVKCGGTPTTTKSCTGQATLKATYKYSTTVTKKVKGKKKKVKVTKSKTVTVGSASYTAPAGGSAPISIKVPSAVTKALKDKLNKKKLSGVLTATNTNGLGFSSQKVTLK